MKHDLEPPITPDERALAEIGCRAAWDAHYRFGLPWPGAMDEDQQHLGIVEMVAALRAVKEAESPPVNLYAPKLTDGRM